MAEKLTHYCAVTTIVTAEALSEYRLLRHSFDVQHPEGCAWYVLCESGIAEDVGCFNNTSIRTFDLQDGVVSFTDIVRKKPEALAFAWAANAWDAVIFLDADILVVNPFLAEVIRPGMHDVQLTPHYFPAAFAKRGRIHGTFNSGMLVTYSAWFHIWWNEVILADSWRFTDQGVLDLAPYLFETGILDRRFNVGWWRSMLSSPELASIVDCKTIHCHLLRCPTLDHEFVQMEFGLSIVNTLLSSENDTQRSIAISVIKADHTTYYETILSGQVICVTACEPAQLLRAIALCKSLPPTIRLICVVSDPPDNSHSYRHVTVPENMVIVYGLVTRELLHERVTELNASWVCAIDIDFTLSIGFWRSLAVTIAKTDIGDGVIFIGVREDEEGSSIGASESVFETESHRLHVVPSMSQVLNYLTRNGNAAVRDILADRTSHCRIPLGDLTTIPCIAIRSRDLNRADWGAAEVTIAAQAFAWHQWYSPETESSHSDWFKRLYCNSYSTEGSVTNAPAL